MCIVEAATGEPVGLIVHVRGLWDGEPCVLLYELKDGASWHEVTPSVVRHLRRMGEAYAARQMQPSFRNVAFELGTEHPAYPVMNDRSPRWKRIRGWYVRVPDIAGFLRHVRPVLERRVADSAVAGYGGTLTIGFVDYGVDLVFDNGRVAEVERLAKPRKGGNWLSSGTCGRILPRAEFSCNCSSGSVPRMSLSTPFPTATSGPRRHAVCLTGYFPNSRRTYGVSGEHGLGPGCKDRKADLEEGTVLFSAVRRTSGEDFSLTPMSSASRSLKP